MSTTMSTKEEVPQLGFLHPEGEGVRILSLDGGDARCLSLLLVLKQLMHRLGRQYGRSVRPCEFFHSITGVGAGGVIAVLLGVLGMTTDEALITFAGLCDKVFASATGEGMPNLAVLRTELEEILKGANLTVDSRLEDATRGGGCPVSICYSSAAIQRCRKFRNYPSTDPSPNPTILEAALVSWAIPGLFPPVHVGTRLLGEKLISAVHLCNNPTRHALHEARELYGSDRPVSAFLSLGSGRRAPLAADHSSEFHRRSAQQTEGTEDNMEREFGLTGVYYRFSPEHTIPSDTFGASEDEFGTIISYTQGYLINVTTSRYMDSYVATSARTSDTYLNFHGEGNVIGGEKGAFYINVTSKVI